MVTKKSKLARPYTLVGGYYPNDSYDQSFGYFVKVSGKIVGFVYGLWPANYVSEATARNTSWAVFDDSQRVNKLLGIQNPREFKTRKAAAEWVTTHKTHGVKGDEITW